MSYNKIITKAVSLPKTIIDPEPYEQALTLECGHYKYWTFGLHNEKLYEGQKTECATCATKPNHDEQL